MEPGDRPAALVILAGTAALIYGLLILAETVVAIYVDRPVVVKDPWAGDLYIPRSKLHIGARTRRHGGITKSRS
jgi:hypothetical protein